MIKNYTAHPHDLVHISAKFRENTAMRFWVTVRKLNVTDRQTDGQTEGRGALQYLPSRAFGAAGDKKLSGSFWEINILSEKLTPTTDDDGRRTNRH